MEIQTLAGFFKLKGVPVGRCPIVVKRVFRALSEPSPFKALKVVAAMNCGDGQSKLGSSDQSHWWETEEGQIRADRYYFLALRFLGSVREVRVS
jgi:hypothetical protein